MVIRWFYNCRITYIFRHKIYMQYVVRWIGFVWLMVRNNRVTAPSRWQMHLLWL